MAPAKTEQDRIVERLKNRRAVAWATITIIALGGILATLNGIFDFTEKAGRLLTNPVQASEMSTTLNVVNAGDADLEIDSVVDLVLLRTSKPSSPEESRHRCVLEPLEPAEAPYVIHPGNTRAFMAKLPTTEQFREILDTGSMDVFLALRGSEGEELARSDPRPFLSRFLEDAITISYAPIRIEIPANPEEALVVWFPFDGDTKDYSVHGVNGDPFGVVATVDRCGHSESAYAFDGDSSAIIVPHGDDLTVQGQITISAWAFPMAKKTQEIVRKGEGLQGSVAAPYSLALSQTDEIVFSLHLGGELVQLRQAGYPLNRWVHLAAVYDGKEMALYVDGRRQTSRRATGSLHENSACLLIGTRLRLPADTFSGRLDDIRIYASALQDDSIAVLSQLNPGHDDTLRPSKQTLTIEEQRSAAEIITREWYVALKNEDTNEIVRLCSVPYYYDADVLLLTQDETRRRYEELFVRDSPDALVDVDLKSIKAHTAAEMKVEGRVDLDADPIYSNLSNTDGVWIVAVELKGQARNPRPWRVFVRQFGEEWRVVGSRSVGP